MLRRPGARDIVADPALTEGMRTWRIAHPQATFAQIEVEATRQVAGLRTELIRTALEAGESVTAPTCAACDRVMHRAGVRTRTITTSHQEQVTVRGHRYRCPACEAELSPPR